MKHTRSLATGVAFLTLALSTSAHAKMATDAEIKAAVSDKTLQGSMVDSKSPYAEFYQADGTIKGDGYTGSWSVKDNAMCYQYGADNPVNCWEVEIHGPVFHWYKDGKIDGAGVVINGGGNTNNF